MQTSEVVWTIKWVDTLLTERTKRILFGYTKRPPREPPQDKSVDEQGPRRGRHEPPSSEMLEATHELAAAGYIMSQNPHAVRVLEAFGLKMLVDKETPTILAAQFVGSGSSDDAARSSQGLAIGRRWRSMMECVGPIEILTVPTELTSDTLPESIISLEIRYTEEKNPSLATLAKATALFENAYSAVARIYEKKNYGSLSVVKIDSGSAVKISCRGIAEAVKLLKEFIMEAWHKFRHKRVEEVIENNRAVLSTLAVMGELDAREQKKSIAPEEAEQLRRAIVESTLGLFECGALITDIPEQETVNNTKLLNSFSPKLLTDQRDAVSGNKPSKQGVTIIKRRPRKRKVQKRG